MADPTSPTSILNSYSVYAVRAIAQRLEIPAADTLGKPEMIKRLAQRLGTDAVVERALAALSPVQRAVLDRLMLLPASINTEQARSALRELLEPAPQRAPGSYLYAPTVEPGDPDKPKSRHFQDIIAALSAWGLVFSVPASNMAQVAELGLRDILVMPGRVRTALLAHYPDTPDPYEPVGVTLDTISPRRIFRDMFRLWTLVRRKPVTLTNSGLLRKADARALGLALGLIASPDDLDDENDLPYLTFLRRLLDRLRLLLQSGLRIEAAGREELRAYFAKPWGERSLELLRDWAAAREFGSGDEIYLPGFSYIAVRPDAFARMRRRLLEHLQRLPAGWIRLADFDSMLQLHDPSLLTAGMPSNLQRYSYSLSAEWSHRESSLIRDALIEQLHWLGIIEIANDDKNRAEGFRLTPAARPLIAALRADESAPDPELLPPSAGDGRVVVQPNFQVLAVGEVPDDVLLRLSEVAELVRIDQAVEFKLTRATVQEAQQTGWAADEILDFLRSASDAPLAQNVERSLRDWTAALDRVLIRRNAGLLLALEPEILDRVEQDAAVKPWIAARPIPGIAVLRPPQGADGAARPLAQLRRALAAAGELAAATDLRSSRPVPQFSFDDAGQVDFRVPLPDLRLLGLLSSIAAPNEDGLLLDEARTRATATARRWKIEDVNILLRELTAWHAGPLPLAVESRVKSWSGFYGRAELRTVTLLVVERADLLQELQGDPELGPLLKSLGDLGPAAIVSSTPGPPAARPRGRTRKGVDSAELAEDQQAVERLRGILSQRGFTVEG